MWTSAYDVPIGKELPNLLIVVLFGGFFNKYSLIVKFTEKLSSRFVMHF